MQELLLYLVTNLADYPEDVKVAADVQNGKTLLTLRVNPADMGKIIGKQGRIIRAIRDLVKVVATKQNIYVDVILAEDENPAPKS
jgi:predicted RNA-binding protein YlqC (UPF0109 family)